MYADRQEAGQKLAQALRHYRGNKDVVVLALPRGGVVLGAEVAKALHAPLDVILVRKITHPFSPEYAIGAVVWGEKPIYNDSEMAGTESAWLEKAVSGEQKVNEARNKLYYGTEFQPVSLRNKMVIVVDDGIATGLTMEAAIRAIKRQHPRRIVVAIPVAPAESVSLLKNLADEVVVLDKSADFLGAVGAYYREFTQVDDKEVRLLLHEHGKKDHR